MKPRIATALTLIGCACGKAASTSRPRSTRSSASRRVICGEALALERVDRHVEAVDARRDERARRRARAGSRWSSARARATSGIAASIATRLGSSRRTSGSPPVRRTSRTPISASTRTSALDLLEGQQLLAREPLPCPRRACSSGSESRSGRSPRSARRRSRGRARRAVARVPSSATIPGWEPRSCSPAAPGAGSGARRRRPRSPDGRSSSTSSPRARRRARAGRRRQGRLRPAAAGLPGRDRARRAAPSAVRDRRRARGDRRMQGAVVCATDMPFVTGRAAALARRSRRAASRCSPIGRARSRCSGATRDRCPRSRDALAKTNHMRALAATPCDAHRRRSASWLRFGDPRRHAREHQHRGRAGCGRRVV